MSYDYKKLTPFKRCVLQNFPFIEADFDALTNYQLLSKVVEYLNKVIDSQNTVTENIEVLNKWFENLDVQDEINKKIDDMAESGELADILTTIFIKNSGTIVGSIVKRDCSDWIKNVTVETETDPIKGYIQGMVTTPSSIIYAVQAGGSYENKLNDVYLYEISKNTGNIIKEAKLELNHANSLAYNQEAGEIYVASTLKIQSNEIVEINSIIVVDYDSFTVKDEITISDDITDGANIGGVSYDNKNKVLAISSSNKMWILSDWETVEETITLNGNSKSQYAMYYDNKIYQVCYFPSGIIVYDKSGNVIKNYFNFDLDVKMGELESIAVEDDGTIYLASVQRSWSTAEGLKFYDRTIFKSNLITNGYKTNEFEQYSDRITTSGVTVYVDPNTTNTKQTGTEDKPFKHIQQAIIMANTMVVPVYISCVSTTDYGFIISRANTKIMVNGGNKATFRAMLTQFQDIVLNECKFDVTDEIEVVSGRKGIYNEYGKIELNNCTIGSRSKITTGFTNFHEKVFINAVTFSDFVNATTNLNGTELTIASATFTACDYKFNNTAYVSINQNNKGIWNDCNPAGDLPLTVNLPQFMDVTVSGNTLTYKNAKMKNIATQVILTYDVNIENWGYHFDSNFRLINTRISEQLKSSNQNAIYFVSMQIGSGPTSLTLTPNVIKLDLGTGTTSDITASCTFTYNSLISL